MSVTDVDDGKIECKLDGARVHAIHIHLKNGKFPFPGAEGTSDPYWTIKRYQEAYPDEPILSARAKITYDAAVSKKREEARIAAMNKNVVMKPLHEVFGLGNSKAALSSRGAPIMISVYETHDDPKIAELVPAIDPNFVFDIELTKNNIIGFEKRLNVYLWGYHGTGKTSNFEQICARTGRPFMRVQHTIGMEEAHVVGQYVVKDGATHWQAGPLQTAMIEGLVFCADEYDRAMPPVISLYQAVLEGKPLVTKEAPPEFRIIKPHPNFRFVATGNTNGCGDETGLYQGTQMQDSANYSRFHITQEVGYMDARTEAAIIAGQSGIDRVDAEKIVSFANELRKEFRAGKISTPIGPRELISAAQLGRFRGGDWAGGIQLAYGNRCTRVDRDVVQQYSQRVWGTR